MAGLADWLVPMMPPIGGPAFVLNRPPSAGNTPGPRAVTPPLAGPFDFMNAATQMSNVAGENRLREIQGQLYGAQGQQLLQQIAAGKEFNDLLVPLFKKAAGQMGGSGGGGGGVTPATAVPAQMAGLPDSDNAPAPPATDLVNVARQAAAKYNVPEDMFVHQINGESSFNPEAKNNVGSGHIGIAQFDPATAKQYSVDPTDPVASLDAAARYMSDLYNKTGSWTSAMQAYVGASTPESLRNVLLKNPSYAKAYAIAHAQGNPQFLASGVMPSAPPGKAGGKPFDSAIGDSIAVGVMGAAKVPGDATSGLGTAAVLGRIANTDPVLLKGKNIFLSSGASNSPDDLAPVAQQLAALKASGANVTLAGVGSGVKNYAAVNDQLAQMAKDAGVPFLGELAGTQGGRVHPKDYNDVVKQAAAVNSPLQPGTIQLAQNTAVPSVQAVPPASPVAAAPAIPQPAFGSIAPPPAAGVPPSPNFLGMSPEMLALLGAKAEAFRLPNVAKPLMEAYLASPAYLSAASTAKAQAENQAKWLGPEASAALQGQLAAAKESAANAAKWLGPEASPELQGNIAAARNAQQIELGRPGSVALRGGVPITAIPQIERVTDPATGQETYRYLTPPLGPQAAANIPDLGVAKIGPGTHEALVVRAKEEQQQRQKVIDEANNAQQTRATLMSMANEAGNFVQGPFAQHSQTAASYLRLINPEWGDKQVASYEDFVKNAGMLTRQAVKDVSSRAAVQEFTMIGSTLPNPEMSPIGLRKVQNELIGLSDYRLAKAQAQKQYEDAHGGIGNVSGFETDFQKQASPYAFIVAKMDPIDRREMFSKLQGSAEGRRELTRLGEQLQFIKQAGLVQ